MSDGGSSEGRQLAARTRVSRVSRAIKPAIETRSYVAFLLRERSQVREFGSRTHLLATGLWPPGMTLDAQLTAFLSQQVQPWATDLSSRLAPVLENGWLYLTPPAVQPRCASVETVQPAFSVRSRGPQPSGQKPHRQAQAHREPLPDAAVQRGETSGSFSPRCASTTRNSRKDRQR